MTHLTLEQVRKLTTVQLRAVVNPDEITATRIALEVSKRQARIPINLGR